MSSDRWRIINADARAGLATLPDQSVQLAVTSPPYLGLRAYSTEPQVWGGDPACSHAWEKRRSMRMGRHGSAIAEGIEGGSAFGKEAIPDTRYVESTACLSCGAWRGELGAERGPEAFAANLVEIFAELRRVLRDDGVLVVNLGDSYNGSGKGPDGRTGFQNHKLRQGFEDRLSQAESVPQQSLMLVPAVFALAMLRAGWVLRSQVRWLKTSSMPESVNGTRWERHKIKTSKAEAHELALQAKMVELGADRNRAGLDARKERGPLDIWTDCPGCAECRENDGLVLRQGAWRPTSAVEECLVFSKAGATYYGDAEGVKVPSGFAPGHRRKSFTSPRAQANGKKPSGNEAHGWATESGSANPRNFWLPEDVYGEPIDGFEAWCSGVPNALLLGPEPFQGAELFGPADLVHLGFADFVHVDHSARIKDPECPVHLDIRVPESECICEPVTLDHFAAFPSSIPKFFIRAYTPEAGSCSECGAPWARVVERESSPRPTSGPNRGGRGQSFVNNGIHGLGGTIDKPTITTTQTRGWRPTCQHKTAPARPAVVLDPFHGSGTTTLAALSLGRHAIGIDLNPKYCALAEKRIRAATEFGGKAKRDDGITSDLPLFAGLGS